MSTNAPSILPEARAAIPRDFIWRLTVSQYHEIVRAGILTDDDPIELLEGWLVTKMPKNPPQRAATRLTQQALQAIAPVEWYVDGQEPITLADSEPEPDAVVVRGAPRDYLDRHPGPGDLALVVEVADSTLERDRAVKKKSYAAASIPVYWILNLIDQRLEVYENPSGPSDAPDYRVARMYARADSVAVLIGNQTVGAIRVADLLP
jgi:Uma2 family endonuclease